MGGERRIIIPGEITAIRNEGFFGSSGMTENELLEMNLLRQKNSELIRNLRAANEDYDKLLETANAVHEQNKGLLKIIESHNIPLDSIKSVG